MQKQNQSGRCSENAWPRSLTCVNAISEFDLLALRFEKRTKLHKLARLGQFISPSPFARYELRLSVTVWKGSIVYYAGTSIWPWHKVLKFGRRIKFNVTGWFWCGGSPRRRNCNNVKVVPVTLTLAEKMRSKFRGHEISIDITAFRLAPTNRWTTFLNVT